MVEHFKYLGAISSADGTNLKELNDRIGKVTEAFRELEKVWKDQKDQPLNLDIKRTTWKNVIQRDLTGF